MVRVRKDGSMGGCSEQGKRCMLCAEYKWNRINLKHCGDQLWMRELPFFSFSGDQGISAMVTVVKGFPGGASGKEPACQCRRLRDSEFSPWVEKIPWRRKWQPTPEFLPRESPWTEEPGGLQSMGSQTVGQDGLSMCTVVKNHCSSQPWRVKSHLGRSFLILLQVEDNLYGILLAV